MFNPDAFRANHGKSGRNFIKENFPAAFQTFNKLAAINQIHFFARPWG